jgi:DNA-directed RNA polymerase subunit beta'
MRTFHIGGAATGSSEQSKQDAKSDGFVRFININTVRNARGELIAMNRNGILALVDDKGREKERYQVVYGAKVLVDDGAPVRENQDLLEWDPYTFSILTEISGTVHFKDLHEGVTMQEQVDEISGNMQLVVIDSPDEKRMPAIEIRPAGGGRHETKRYLMPTHAHLMVRDGEEIHAGDVLAKIPRATTKTKDITGGLPRVVELFEARKPRETAVIAEINGVVKYGEVAKGTRKVYIVGDDGTQREYALPRGVHINVQEGERVRAGDPLMDGPRNPHDILHVLGENELQKYLVNEIQEVYRLQGVNINDKHLEVIVRQMMRWVKVEDIGDTEFLPEEIVDKFKFREENNRVIEAGGRPATGKPTLLGITKASLSTDSFISAASFQETTRVLTEAAINGKVDYLRGLKENVIMGRLIPAGTGMEYYRHVKIAGEDVVEEEMMVDTDVTISEGIPGYDEDARIQYAGGLNEGTPEELAE